MNYIDVHCHINFPEYDADRDEVIRRAADAGVGMIAVGTDIISSSRAVEMAEKYENVWAIVGQHPVDASSEQGFDYDAFKKLAVHPKVVAIGECGLDYFHAENRLSQKKVFEDQIHLACEVRKPLMLHIRNGKNMQSNEDLSRENNRDSSRNAYKDAIDILKKSKDAGMNIAGDVHFFAGGLEYARQFVELGFHLSFTGVITFAKEYEEIIRAIPLERILSETDAPFVAPIPYRGKRNEPLYVVEVAKAIAKIRSEKDPKDSENVETEKIVLEALVKNAKNLFSLENTQQIKVK